MTSALFAFQSILHNNMYRNIWFGLDWLKLVVGVFLLAMDGKSIGMYSESSLPVKISSFDWLENRNFTVGNSHRRQMEMIN